VSLGFVGSNLAKQISFEQRLFRSSELTFSLRDPIGHRGFRRGWFQQARHSPAPDISPLFAGRTTGFPPCRQHVLSRLSCCPPLTCSPTGSQSPMLGPVMFLEAPPPPAPPRVAQFIPPTLLRPSLPVIPGTFPPKRTASRYWVVICGKQ